MNADECIITEEALQTIVEIDAQTEGVRDLEQIAEHVVANALYQIEVDGVSQVVFDEEKIRNLIG